MSNGLVFLIRAGANTGAAGAGASTGALGLCIILLLIKMLNNLVFLTMEGPSRDLAVPSLGVQLCVLHGLL